MAALPIVAAIDPRKVERAREYLRRSPRRDAEREVAQDEEATVARRESRRARQGRGWEFQPRCGACSAFIGGRQACPKCGFTSAGRYEG